MSNSNPSDTTINEVESHARYIGTAVLFIDADGTWSVGQVGQTVASYQKIKVNGAAGINDLTFNFTALTASAGDNGGYVVDLQSNNDPNQIYQATLDAQGNFTGGKLLSKTEIYAEEAKLGVDLNDNGGLGDTMVLVDAGKANIYVDGMGTYQIQSDGKNFAVTVDGQTVSLSQTAGLTIRSAAPDGAGFKIYASDTSGNIYQAEASASGNIAAQSIMTLDANQLAAAETRTGEDIDCKGDASEETGWTAILKTAAIRTAVETQTANGAKINHAGLVKIVDAAIASLAGASSVGADVFNDLKAIAAHAKALFTSKDTTGAENGYLQFIFEKMVNGSQANGYYTGGAAKPEALGNLGANSPVSTLQKLENKWLLGLDLPSPATGGDAANPAAAAASGVYKTFDAPLFVDGAATFDVKQGSMGDCYLLASAATVAKVSPTLLAQSFDANGTGAGGLQTWGVRFFDNKGAANWVTVNNQFVVRNSDDTSPAYAKLQGTNAQGESAEELWLPLLEKAYAQANEMRIFGLKAETNAMVSIEGGYPSSLINLTGMGITNFWDKPYPIGFSSSTLWTHSPVPAGSTKLKELTAALNAGKPFFVGSFTDTKDANGKTLWTPYHAYILYDADTTSSTNTTVKVFNPWGYTADGTNAKYVAPFDADLVTLVGNSDLAIWVGV